MATKIGIIGGSGIYNMGIIKEKQDVTVETPFGSPSDTITIGTINNTPIAFLPRHGKHHTIPPHLINNKANIFALKECGVEYLISTAAVGSLQEHIKPLDFVIANQFIDRTYRRISTFFDTNIVTHVGLAEPFCPQLSQLLYTSCENEGVTVHTGTYLCIEGPHFSTKAESQLYRSWNADVIGMTLAPEAKLAREAELCLGAILAVTDYDVWHSDQESVSVTGVIENAKKNSQRMANILQKVVPEVSYQRTCDCKTALQNAMLTNPDIITKHIDPHIRNLLLKNAVLK